MPDESEVELSAILTDPQFWVFQVGALVGGVWGLLAARGRIGVVSRPVGAGIGFLVAAAFAALVFRRVLTLQGDGD